MTIDRKPALIVPTTDDRDLNLLLQNMAERIEKLTAAAQDHEGRIETLEEAQ